MAEGAHQVVDHLLSCRLHKLGNEISGDLLVSEQPALVGVHVHFLREEVHIEKLPKHLVGPAHLGDPRQDEVGDELACASDSRNTLSPVDKSAVGQGGVADLCGLRSPRSCSHQAAPNT